MASAPPAHNAMASEEELDPEGWLLAEARKILGEE